METQSEGGGGWLVFQWGLSFTFGTRRGSSYSCRVCVLFSQGDPTHRLSTTGGRLFRTVDRQVPILSIYCHHHHRGFTDRDILLLLDHERVCPGLFCCGWPVARGERVGGRNPLLSVPHVRTIRPRHARKHSIQYGRTEQRTELKIVSNKLAPILYWSCQFARLY